MNNEAEKATLDTLSNKIDKLASVVESGFAAVDTRFEAVDKRFEKVEQKIDGLEKRMDGLEQKMDEGFKKVDEDIESLAAMTAKGFEDVADQIVTLTQTQENLKLSLDGTAPAFEVRDLDRRVKVLENEARISRLIPN